MQILQLIRITLFLLYLFTSFLFAQQWQYKTPMPTDRKGMSVAVLENKIWVIGGKQMWQNALNVVEVYDPSTDSWNTQIPNISHARENATARVWNGKIYLFGGRNNHNLVNEVEVFDPGIGSWQTINMLPTPRFGLASVIVDSSIWLIGGTDMHFANYNLIEIYYPENNSWSTLPASLNIARGNPMAAFIDSSVYVFGGDYFGPVINYEKYDFSNQTWLNAGNMLYSCGSTGYLTLSNQVWLIGGLGQSGTLGTVQKFFLNGGNPLWVTEPSLNTARRELVAATVNNKIYAIGGRGMMGEQVYDSVEELDVLVGILPQEPIQPDDFVTIINYPNPFNNSTQITVQIPENDIVSLKVYDISGRIVSRIFEGTIQAGTRKFYFNAINSSGIPLSSGIYYIHYEGNKFSEFKKINLIK